MMAAVSTTPRPYKSRATTRNEPPTGFIHVAAVEAEYGYRRGAYRSWAERAGVTARGVYVVVNVFPHAVALYVPPELWAAFIAPSNPLLPRVKSRPYTRSRRPGGPREPWPVRKAAQATLGITDNQMSRLIASGRLVGVQWGAEHYIDPLSMRAVAREMKRNTPPAHYLKFYDVFRQAGQSESAATYTLAKLGLTFHTYQTVNGKPMRYLSPTAAERYRAYLRGAARRAARRARERGTPTPATEELTS